MTPLPASEVSASLSESTSHDGLLWTVCELRPILLVSPKEDLSSARNMIFFTESRVHLSYDPTIHNIDCSSCRVGCQVVGEGVADEGLVHPPPVA